MKSDKENLFLIGILADEKLLINEFKAFLKKSYPNLIKEEQNPDIPGFELKDILDPSLRYGAKIRITTPELISAYSEFCKLPRIKLILNPPAFKLNDSVKEWNVLKKFKDYVLEEYPQLANLVNEDGTINGAIYMAKYSQILITNPDLYNAYQQFKELPHIAFMLAPKTIEVDRDDAARINNDFKKYLEEKHPGLPAPDIFRWNHGPSVITIHDKEFIMPGKLSFSPGKKTRFKHNSLLT